jgi:hypothetical protein
MRFMHRNERECEITLYLLILWDLCQVCSVDALRNLLSVFVTRKFIFDISFDVDTVSPLTKSVSPLTKLLRQRLSFMSIKLSFASQYMRVPTSLHI